MNFEIDFRNARPGDPVHTLFTIESVKLLDKPSPVCYNTHSKGGATVTKEKLIERIMRECAKDGEPVTKEEAEEMAEMEIKAGGLRRYEQSDKPRKPTTKTRKVDETKKRILNNCRVLLEGMGAVTAQVKTETEICFTFEGEEYSLKLVKHRPKEGD